MTESSPSILKSVSIPSDLDEKLQLYRANHPEFNLSGYVRKCIQKLLLESTE